MTGNASSQESKNIIENAKEIEITKSTVRFGSSVYQFKNVTGFKVDKVPRWKLPLQLIWTFIWVGILISIIAISISSGDYNSDLDSLGMLLFQVGIFSIIIALSILFAWLFQTQPLAFALYLNSGHVKMFVSHDRNFLMKIVNALYDLMKSNTDYPLLIDMSNRSVTVGGDFHGKVSTGNQNTLH